MKFEEEKWRQWDLNITKIGMYQRRLYATDFLKMYFQAWVPAWILNKTVK